MCIIVAHVWTMISYWSCIFVLARVKCKNFIFFVSFSMERILAKIFGEMSTKNLVKFSVDVYNEQEHENSFGVDNDDAGRLRTGDDAAASAKNYKKGVQRRRRQRREGIVIPTFEKLCK